MTWLILAWLTVSLVATIVFLAALRAGARADRRLEELRRRSVEAALNDQGDDSEAAA